MIEIRMADLLNSVELSSSGADDSEVELDEGETTPVDVLAEARAKLRAEGDTTHIVLFDQFEDFFRLAETDRDLLTILIRALISAAGERHQVLFTLRSDYEWQMRRPEFFLRPHWTIDTIYRVPPLDLKELEEVITEPAWQAMYDFRDHTTEGDSRDVGEQLINEIVSDFANAPGALPLLSYTMQAFYEKVRPDVDIPTEGEAEAEDDALNEHTREFTLSVYQNEIRGIEGMISKRADEVFESLSDDQKAMARTILLRMVEPQEGGFAGRRLFVSMDDVNGTLQPDEDNQANNELIFGDTEKMSLAYQVVTAFGAAHLLVFDDNKPDGIRNVFLSPAHDALITHWDKCLAWIEEFGADSLILQRQLWEAAIEESLVGEARPFRRSVYEPVEVVKMGTARDRSALDDLRDSEIEGDTLLWDSSPKLTEIINAVIYALDDKARAVFLDMKEISVEERARYEIFLDTCQEKQEIRDLDPFILSGESDKFMRLLLKGGHHWLNLKEDDFIIRSWQRRTKRILDLIRQRNEARSTALAAQARQSLPDNRTIALNLALEANALAETPEAAAILTEILSKPEEIFYHQQYEYQTQVRSMALSPDGNTVAAGTRFGHLVVADTFGDRILTELLGHAIHLSSAAEFPENKHSVRSLAYSPIYEDPDGKRQYIATGSRNDEAKIWNATRPTPEDRALITSAPGEYETDINALAFHPSDSLVAIASEKDNKGCVDVWRIKEDNSRVDVFQHLERDRGVKSVTFSPDGAYLLSGWTDGKARLITLKTDNLSATNYGDDGFSFHEDDGTEIVALAFIPQVQGQPLMVVTGKSDHTAVIWAVNPDGKSAKKEHTLEGHSGEVSSVTAFVIDRKAYVLTGSTDNTARLWDVATGLQLLKLTDHSGDISGVAFSSNSNQAYTASRDRTVKCWYLDGTLPLHILDGADGRNGHEGSVRAVAFAPDGERVVTGSSDKTAKVWLLSDGEVLFTLGPPNADDDKRHQGEVTAVACDPLGRFIATGSKDDDVMVWDARNGDHIITLSKHVTTVQHVAFSEDGSEIYSVSEEFVKITWPVDESAWGRGEGDYTSAETGFDTSTLPPVDVAFSPDEERSMIVTKGIGNMAMVWSNTAKTRRTEGYIYQFTEEERKAYDIDMELPDYE